jgi:hypothetical protein
MKSPIDIILTALRCIGGKFDTVAAVRMLIAIGYQESGFKHRKQRKGPAVGFWQFERGGGIFGVISHRTTKALALQLFKDFSLGKTTELTKAVIMDRLYSAFQKDEFDVLAACYARLLLWTHPKALPNNEEEAWQYYLDVWRPGKPHKNRWSENWEKANEAIKSIDHES